MRHGRAQAREADRELCFACGGSNPKIAYTVGVSDCPEGTLNNLLELAPAQPHRFRELFVIKSGEEVVTSRVEADLEIR